MADKEIMTGRAQKDEAAYVFRKYARLGLDKRVLKTFEVYEVIRGICRSEEEAMKLLAVYDTVRLLSLTSPESLNALRAVYFFDRGKKPLKNQIGHRVLRFASENHCDERTVYRLLKKAKDMYYHILAFGK
jgi:hypothetical protein